MGVWNQVYDPFGSFWLSTLAVAVPVVVLLGAIGILEMKAHYAALLGLASALLIAVFGFGMPASMAGLAAAYGAVPARLAAARGDDADTPRLVIARRGPALGPDGSDLARCRVWRKTGASCRGGVRRGQMSA